MSDSLQKQIREIKHHDLVLWGLIALAIAFIIWLLLRKHPIGYTTKNTYGLNDSPVYSIGGNSYTIPPPLGYPGNQYNLFPANSPQMTPGPPCSCGCTSCGGNSSGTTFTFPDFSGLFDTTISALQAADLSLINGITSNLAYGERVFVTNNTPTGF